MCGGIGRGTLQGGQWRCVWRYSDSPFFFRFVVTAEAAELSRDLCYVREAADRASEIATIRGLKTEVAVERGVASVSRRSQTKAPPSLPLLLT